MAFPRQLLTVLTVVLVLVHGSTGFSVYYHSPGYSSKLSEPAYVHHEGAGHHQLKVLPSTVYFYDAVPPPPPKPSYQILFGCNLKVPEYEHFDKSYGHHPDSKVYRASYKYFGKSHSHPGSY